MLRQLSESEAVKFVGKQLPGTEPYEEVKDTKKKKGKKSAKEVDSSPVQPFCPISKNQALEIFTKNKVNESLVSTLADFLYPSIITQFYKILAEANTKTSGKANAKENELLESEAEKSYQVLKFILKQIETTSLDITATQAVHHYLCKNQASRLITNLIQI
jgi:hypothetical protein